MTVQRLPPAKSRLVYKTFTAVTVSGTSGSQSAVVTFDPLIADGYSSYWVDFYSPQVSPGASDAVLIDLWEGATDLGVMGQWSAAVEGFARTSILPSAGSHTYALKAWRVTNNGTINGAAGGPTGFYPAFVAISRA